MRGRSRVGLRLSVCLLLVLMAIVFLGTFAAARDGVLAAQERYFHAWIAWHPVAPGVSLPLPGVRFLLLALLALLLVDRGAWSPRPGAGAVVAVHSTAALLLCGATFLPAGRHEGTVWLPRGEFVAFSTAADGRRIPLPFGLRLLAHERRFHPGTQVLAAVEATVEVVCEGIPLTARITPNRPLRTHGHALYLPSTSADEPTALGATRLVAARDVWGNPSALVGGLLGLALAWHFGSRAFSRRGRAEPLPEP